MPNKILNPNRYKKISKKEKDKKKEKMQNIPNGKNRKYSINKNIYKTTNKRKYYNGDKQYNISDEQNDKIKEKITKIWKERAKKVVIVALCIIFLIGIVKVANVFYSRFEEKGNITDVFNGIFGIEQDNVNLNYELKIGATNINNNNLFVAELDKNSNSYLLDYDLSTYKIKYELIEDVNISEDGKNYRIAVKKNTNLEGYVRFIT